MPRCLVALFALFGLMLAGCPVDDGETGPTDVIEDPTWTEHVQPILQDYCSGCHEGTASASGGIAWLNSYDEATVVADAPECEGSTRAECYAGRIERGEMPLGAACPPGDDGCITEDQFTTLQNWVDDGFPE